MEFNFQAGGGRRAKEEVAKALEVALTPLAQSFIEFAQSISELAKRERERADVAEGLNDSVFEARALDVTQWDEPIKHIAVMLNSETPQVQLQASTTLGDMAQCVSATKARICRLPMVMPGLTKILNNGVLEAITAVHYLCADNELACDQAADAGAVPILAAFINVDDGGAGGDNKDSDAESNFEKEEAKPAAAQGRRKGEQPQRGKRSQSSVRSQAVPTKKEELSGTHTLAELRGDKLTEAFVQLGAGVDDRPNADGAQRATIIPIAIKAQVVATLRSIATSSDRNLAALTREKRVVSVNQRHSHPYQQP